MSRALLDKRRDGFDLFRMESVIMEEEDKELYKKHTRIMRDAVLPPVLIDGKNVSPASIHSALCAIHSRAGLHGTCWASYPRLAQDSKMSVSQMKRCMAALRKLSLLIEREGREGRTNVVYRTIHFGNLEDFCLQQRPLDFVIEDELPDLETLKTVVVDRSTVDRSIPLTGQPAVVDRSTCGSLTGQQLTPKYPLRNQVKNSINESENGFFKIDVSELNNPSRVQELWFLNCGWHPQHYQGDEETRRRFFAFCHQTYRSRNAGSIDDAVALFSSRVKQGSASFWFDDDHDMEWAKRVIAELDGVVLVGSAEHRGTGVDDDFDREERERLQRLRLQGEIMESLGERFFELQQSERDAISENPAAWMRSEYAKRKRAHVR